MSTPSRSISLTLTSGQRALGRLTALTLMEELRFLTPRRRIATDSDLIELGSERPDFQKIHGEAAAKSDMAASFIANTAGLRVCIASGMVLPGGLLDIDHTDAYSGIISKQKALLDYLNAGGNADFAEGFLSADRHYENKNGENVTESISKYFGRNDTDGPIKGTRYFYCLCYNDIDNLLLLAHHYNLSKGNQDSLKWFAAQEPFLGARFVDAVTQAGGLHEGIIVQKVMSRAGKRVVTIGGVECVLHEGEGVGLGRFINEWFDTQYPGYRLKAITGYQEIWLEYKSVLDGKVNASSLTEAGQADRVSGKLHLTLRGCIQVVQRHYGFRRGGEGYGPYVGSPSSSDDSGADNARIDAIDKKVMQMLTEMHSMKQLYKNIPEPVRMKINKTEYYSALIQGDPSWMDLEVKQKEAAMLEMQSAMQQLSHDSNPEEVSRLIQSITDQHSAAGIAKAAQQRVEAAQQKAEVERQERMRYQAENEQLKRELDARKRGKAPSDASFSDDSETSSEKEPQDIGNSNKSVVGNSMQMGDTGSVSLNLGEGFSSAIEKQSSTPTAVANAQKQQGRNRKRVNSDTGNSQTGESVKSSAKNMRSAFGSEHVPGSSTLDSAFSNVAATLSSLQAEPGFGGLSGGNTFTPAATAAAANAEEQQGSNNSVVQPAQGKEEDLVSSRSSTTLVRGGKNTKK